MSDSNVRSIAWYRDNGVGKGEDKEEQGGDATAFDNIIAQNKARQDKLTQERKKKNQDLARNLRLTKK